MISLESLQIGMVFIITESGEKAGWGPRKSEATIKSIKIDSGGDVAIGMHFQAGGNPRYHNLDNTVKDGHGYWLTSAQLLSPGFLFIQENVTLRPGIRTGERNIGNKQGRILKYLPKAGYVMVELLEDIEGCSGDGLGRAGHCVLLKKNEVLLEKNETNSKKNKSKEKGE